MESLIEVQEMANVLSVVWFVIAYVVSASALMVWTALMLPNPVERARQRAATGPVASFFIGAVIWGCSLLVLIGLLKGKHALLQLLGWASVAPALAASVVGGAGIARLLGERIERQMKNEAPLPALIGGALCTTLAGLLPIVGWVVFFPAATFVAIGSGALGILSKRRVAEAQPRMQPAPAPVLAPEVPGGFILAEQPIQQG